MLAFYAAKFSFQSWPKIIPRWLRWKPYEESAFANAGQRATVRSTTAVSVWAEWQASRIFLQLSQAADTVGTRRSHAKVKTFGHFA